jgi:RNA polymerase sigma-70 factor (ECF subfamily)
MAKAAGSTHGTARRGGPDDWAAVLEDLYHTHGREMWAILYAQCVNADLALEALQEGFLRLAAQPARSVNDPRAWVLRVARNWLTDLRRKEGRVSSESVDWDELLASDASTEEQMEREELRDVVRSALAELREEDREVLVLRYAMGWPSVRIAEKFATTSAAVDMRLSRARNRLAELLARRGVQHETV